MSDIDAQLSNMEQILKVLNLMVGTINPRTIYILKEQNKVKYMFELRKAKQLSSSVKDLSEEDVKQYKVKRRMYLGKLLDSSIKLPKPQTLEYYKIVMESEVHKISED